MPAACAEFYQLVWAAPVQGETLEQIEGLSVKID
jgi:hypothetical protein